MRIFIVSLFVAALVVGAVPAQAADVAAGQAKFNIMCMACHGATGKGDGPAGAQLNPKPRNYTDVAWQEKTTDERIKAVITKGGVANGLSPMMPALGAALTDADIENLIAFIRSLKGKK